MWKVESFRESDDGLEWEIYLVSATRAALEEELGFSMPTPDGYPISGEQVRRLAKFARPGALDGKVLDDERFAFFVEAVADKPGDTYDEVGFF